MIDPKLIRESPELVKDSIKKRNKDASIVDLWLKADKEFREVKGKIDELRHKRNTFSSKISELKKSGKEKEAKAVIKEAQELPEMLSKSEAKLAELESRCGELLAKMPNLLEKHVPIGKTAEDNKVIRKWGKIPKFKFPLKNHEELAESLKIADFDAGRNNAGQGFNYLLGELAMLDLALQRYGVDYLLKNKFKLVSPPLMLNKETLAGAVDLSAFQEVVYKLENEDLYLIGTGEHSLVSLMKNKSVIEKDLPMKLCTVTPCFRKEIGAHGVDTKGLFRMHQFNKVEQVVITTPEQSFKTLEQMQKLTESFFKKLKIPFRVIELCSGDLGQKFAKQYDIDAWFPRQNQYKEVTSAGNPTDYQSRALNTKYKEKEGQQAKGFVHILNNTMVATSRAMVAILENYQQKDGTIKVPSALHKYMNGIKVLGKKK